MGFLHSCKWSAHPRRFIKMCNVHVYYIRPKDHHLQPRKPSTNTCHLLFWKNCNHKENLNKEGDIMQSLKYYVYLFVRKSELLLPIQSCFPHFCLVSSWYSLGIRFWPSQLLYILVLNNLLTTTVYGCPCKEDLSK